MWITVHPQAPESPQFPFFINDRGQPEGVHTLALLCPEMCIANIIRGSNLPDTMDACAQSSIGSIATASLAHVRTIADKLIRDAAERGLHFHISSHLFGQKVFLRPGEQVAGTVVAFEFEHIMLRLSYLLQFCVLTADEFRTEFLKKSVPSKLAATIMGCVTCGAFERPDGRPLREFCSVCKCAYYCSAQHKADDARSHVQICPDSIGAAAAAERAAPAPAPAPAPAGAGGGVRSHQPPSAPPSAASPASAASSSAAPIAPQPASISRQQLLDVIRSIELEDPRYFRSELQAHARLLAAVRDKTGWTLELKRIKSVMQEYVPLQLEQGAGGGAAEAAAEDAAEEAGAQPPIDFLCQISMQVMDGTDLFHQSLFACTSLWHFAVL